MVLSMDPDNTHHDPTTCRLALSPTINAKDRLQYPAKKPATFVALIVGLRIRLRRSNKIMHLYIVYVAHMHVSTYSVGCIAI